MTAVTVAAVSGAGLVTGLLFAFSNCVMRALGELPADKGMFAMQRINEIIINPVFVALFFGTPILCSAIVVESLPGTGAPGTLIGLVGALVYLAGPFGITVFFNVPLNNRLARTPLSDAAEIWPMYREKWQRWNHVRTGLGVISLVLLSIGLAWNGA